MFTKDLQVIKNISDLADTFKRKDKYGKLVNGLDVQFNAKKKQFEIYVYMKSGQEEEDAVIQKILDTFCSTGYEDRRSKYIADYDGVVTYLIILR